MKFLLLILLPFVTAQFFVLVAPAFHSCAGGGIINLNSRNRTRFTTFSQPAWHVQSTDPNDVKFLLYSNSTLKNAYHLLPNLPFNVKSLRQSGFKPNADTILLIHGFLQSNGTWHFPTAIKNAYLDTRGNGSSSARNPANIIVIDWSLLTFPKQIVVLSNDELPQPLTDESTANVPKVGARVAEFLDFLRRKGLIGDVHIVGFSAGAQIAAWIGQVYQQLSGGRKIDRITGLDPGGAYFQCMPANQTLDPSDATFVDIVHTNQGEFGYNGRIGHVDFYINGGGPKQPGCEQVKRDNFAFCAHNIVAKYFKRSIRNNSIKACPQDQILPWPPSACDPKEQITFGEYCPTRARGEYGLTMAP